MPLNRIAPLHKIKHAGSVGLVRRKENRKVPEVVIKTCHTENNRIAYGRVQASFQQCERSFMHAVITYILMADLEARNIIIRRTPVFQCKNIFTRLYIAETY